MTEYVDGHLLVLLEQLFSEFYEMKVQFYRDKESDSMEIRLSCIESLIERIQIHIQP